ncbi:hypothetical protein GQ457_11G002200 [Hibiscus cannabinus]
MQIKQQSDAKPILHHVISQLQNLRNSTYPVSSLFNRDVKSGTRLGFRSGHFRSGRVRFRSGSFQVGFVPGRVISDQDNGYECSLLPQSTVYNFSCGHFSNHLLTAKDDSVELLGRREKHERFALEHITKCQYSCMHFDFFCSFHANFYYGTNRFLIFTLLAVSKLNNNDQLLAGIQDSRHAQEHPYNNLSLLL